MRLKYQLFLTLLLTSALLIALMALISNWSFNRGFISYINDTERSQLDPLVEALAVGYAREGDWHWISDDRRTWAALLEKTVGFGRPRAVFEARPEPPGRLENATPDTQSGPTPGGADSVRAQEPPGPSSRNSPTLTLDPRLLLANADKRVLIGRERYDSNVIWQAVSVSGRDVGYLGHRERKSLPGQLDQAFASQQRRSFLYASLCLVLLSALLAVLLAGRLVRPLLEVKDVVARIGRGQYDSRVPEVRRDEIGDVAHSINALAATLAKNLDARRQWSAEISHELRTPIAILQGELEAIQDGVNRPSEQAIASLHAETLRLARLINDLHDLTLADVGALDYRFEQFDLGDVVAERVSAACGPLDVASLSITVTPPLQPLYIDGDAQRLGQVVDNLLQNSCRYTDEGGELHIGLSTAHGRAIINWTDSLPGVDDEQLGQLFEPLYRADVSRSREHGGAGLGLAIVQRIVEAHGGTIVPDHSPLGGLSLRIEIPLAGERST